MRHSNTHIYFVRHGRVYNPKDIFYGRLPRIPLKKESKLDLEKAALYLKTRNPSCIFSSPLLRTRQTAEIIQKALKLPQISISKNLIDVNSYMEGKPYDFGKQSHFDHYFTPDSKETMQDIADRIMKFVNHIVKTHSGENIIAVSHGDPLMILQAMINKRPLTLDVIRPGRDLYVKYGEVYDLTVQPNGEMMIQSVYNPPAVESKI